MPLLLLLLPPMTLQEADRRGQIHNTCNVSAGCILHCIFTQTHFFSEEARGARSELQFGLSHREGHKSGKNVGIINGSRSQPRWYNIPYHEKAICVGIKGDVLGLQRPVKSITNSSLPFCSESVHVAEHVKALSHRSNRLLILAITAAFQFQPRKGSVPISALLQCTWCKIFALKTSFIVFSQGLH